MPGLYRVANWPKVIQTCVFCGSSGPKTAADRSAEALTALQNNMKEVPGSAQFRFLSGRGQAVGKRAASSAYWRDDYCERVSADCGLYGSSNFIQSDKQACVNMCSFWCARFCDIRPYSFFTDDISLVANWRGQAIGDDKQV